MYISARFLRYKDREMNRDIYPNLFYPEIYVLDGGYSAYFTKNESRREPFDYVSMNDSRFSSRRKEERSKLSRSRVSDEAKDLYKESIDIDSSPCAGREKIWAPSAHQQL